MATDNTEIVNYIKQFISKSKLAKQDRIDIWDEVLCNYLVVPPGFTGRSQNTADIFDTSERLVGLSTAYIKDPETKQALDTLLANCVLALLGGRTGQFIAAERVGWEDAQGAEAVTRLFQRWFHKPKVYQTLFGWFKDMFLFGTGITKLDYEFVEDLVPVRSLVVDVDGQTSSVINQEYVVVKDDPRIMNVDVLHFFPNHGFDNLDDMNSCAELFEISSYQAKQLARNGMYDMEAVERAIQRRESMNLEEARHINQSPEEADNPGYNMLKGVDFWGELPLEEDPAKRWRLITILENEVVRNIDWPLPEKRLPFYDATIGWMAGTFWGQSPGADARYQQDMIDYFLRMTTESVRRAVQPPIIYNVEDDFDRQRLEAWTPDVAIGMQHPEQIRTLPYSANLQAGFGLVSNIKNSMRENTSATSIVQGYGLPNSRSSAAEAVGTFRAALARVEMINQFVERVCLPRLGRGLFKLYQWNLEDDQDLINRIGTIPGTNVSLFTIDGDFDVSFVGTRNHISAEARLAGLDRLFQIAGVPQLANLLDWQSIGGGLLDTLGFTEAAAKIANPQRIQQNVALQQLAGANPAFGNGNGNLPSLPPAGLPPTQGLGDITPTDLGG